MTGLPPSRTLVVLCPNWPVTALGHPPDAHVAIVEGERVVAVSPAARALGVRIGQRRREAQSHCPELRPLARDEAGELRAFEPVVRALEAFGAPVMLGKPGWAGLRLRGPARYFGGEASFVERVGESLAALLGAPARPLSSEERRAGAAPAAAAWRIGVAEGTFAATLAARAARIVPHEATVEFLSPFPVEVLGHPDLSGLLHRLGIASLGDFAALGEGDVLARLGSEGGRLQQLARGLQEQPSLLRGQHLDLIAEVLPDPPIERVDEATFAVRALAGALGEKLSSGGLACTLLEVAVELSDGEQIVRRWRNDGPLGTSLTAERLRFQLETFLLGKGPLKERSEGAERGITRLRLEAVEALPDRGRQSQFWGRAAWTEERVERVFARLQGIAGPEAVLRPVLVGGRGPRERVRLLPFGAGLPSDEAPLEPPWPGRLPPPNPALVASGEIAVGVLDKGGEALRVTARGALSAPPAAVTLGGAAPSEVVAWAGPWPAEEHWWEPAAHRRRARLQVLLESGEAYLLVVEGGRWLLEGCYD